MKTKANRRRPLLKTLEGTTSSKALSWLHGCSMSVTSWLSSNHFVEQQGKRSIWKQFGPVVFETPCTLCSLRRCRNIGRPTG